MFTGPGNITIQALSEEYIVNLKPISYLMFSLRFGMSELF